jgi:hypothetical protein
MLSLGNDTLQLGLQRDSAPMCKPDMFCLINTALILHVYFGLLSMSDKKLRLKLCLLKSILN